MDFLFQIQTFNLLSFEKVSLLVLGQVKQNAVSRFISIERQNADITGVRFSFSVQSCVISRSRLPGHVTRMSTNHCML